MAHALGDQLGKDGSECERKGGDLSAVTRAYFASAEVARISDSHPLLVAEKKLKKLGSTPHRLGLTGVENVASGVWHAR